MEKFLSIHLPISSLRRFTFGMAIYANLLAMPCPCIRGDDRRNASSPCQANADTARYSGEIVCCCFVLFYCLHFSHTSSCLAFYRNQQAAMLPPAAADPRRGSGQRPSSRTTTAFRFFHQLTATVVATATIATDCHNHHVRIHQPYSLWRRRKM